jgi:hypothetical protein
MYKKIKLLCVIVRKAIDLGGQNLLFFRFKLINYLLRLSSMIILFIEV